MVDDDADDVRMDLGTQNPIDERLDQLRKLFPEAFPDGDLIGHVQAYYADLWEKVAAMHKQGIPVADAARDVDMTNHASTLGIRRKGVDPQAVGRIYARLDGAD